MNRNAFEKHAPQWRSRAMETAMRVSTAVDPRMGDDVAQDTLLRLWNMRERLDRYQSVEALAVVIARNITIDRLRQMRSAASVNDEHMEAQIAPSPEENYLCAELSKNIEGIIERLPAIQKAVFTLRHLEGLELSEIAKMTGASEGAVRTALSRARQKIRNYFMSESL